MKEVKTILISRTDNIGDVVLTLPLANVLKEKFRGCKVIFLGKTYTKPIIECCVNVDEILCWDEISQLDKKKQIDLFRSLNADCIIHVFPNKQVAALAKGAGIPIRIGTSHRLFHWFTCNKLPNFTRKNSDLHEVQLNFKLLQPLGVESNYSLKDIDKFFGFRNIKPLSTDISSMIDRGRCNLILHPKSKGSALEWGIPNFSKLIGSLPKEKFKIFVTGTQQEREGLKDIFSYNPDVVDLAGKLSLPQLISFINNCDALVAASTGPLHLAAVLGKKAVGIYPAKRPIHPGRWAPVGKNASVVVSTKTCKDCRKGTCDCMSSVKPEEVAAVLMRDLTQKVQLNFLPPGQTIENE